MIFAFTTAHVFLRECSCLLSRALINYKKVYTFLNFGVHLSGVCCTPFHKKVYTFFNYRAYDFAFTCARVAIYECSRDKTFILRILREIIDIRTLCPLHVPKAHFVKRFGSKEQIENLLCVKSDTDIFERETHEQTRNLRTVSLMPLDGAR